MNFTGRVNLRPFRALHDLGYGASNRVQQHQQPGATWEGFYGLITEQCLKFLQKPDDRAMREAVLITMYQLLNGDPARMDPPKKETTFGTHEVESQLSSGPEILSLNLDRSTALGASSSCNEDLANLYVAFEDLSKGRRVCVLWHMELNPETKRQDVCFWRIVFQPQLKKEREHHRRELRRLSSEYAEKCRMRKQKKASTSKHQSCDFFYVPHVFDSVPGLKYRPCVAAELEHHSRSLAERRALGLSRSKYYDLQRPEHFHLLWETKSTYPPLRLSEEERQLVNAQTACFVSGRAGTGKTQTVVLRGVRQWKEAVGMGMDAHQCQGGGQRRVEQDEDEEPAVGNEDASCVLLCVTLSPVLALQIDKYVSSIEKSMEVAGEKNWQKLNAVVNSRGRGGCLAGIKKDATGKSAAAARLPLGAAGRYRDEDASQENAADAEDTVLGIGFQPLTPAERDRELARQPQSFEDFLVKANGNAKARNRMITSYSKFLAALDASVNDGSAFFSATKPEREVSFQRFRQDYFDHEVRDHHKNAGLRDQFLRKVEGADCGQVWREFALLRTYIDLTDEDAKLRRKFDEAKRAEEEAAGGGGTKMNVRENAITFKMGPV
eukprot:g18532.t1